ncbi:hypothetical protein MKleb_5877 (plasmid) [Klebsiella sp. PL-2018]|nr:hypothetical protein MKleb_5877 [Klebsiella sp. PL-2018]
MTAYWSGVFLGIISPSLPDQVRHLLKFPHIIRHQLGVGHPRSQTVRPGLFFRKPRNAALYKWLTSG